MKKTISVTVDSDAYLIAKDKLENISEYLNSCLLSLGNSVDISKDEADLRREVDILREAVERDLTRKAVIESQLRELDKEKEQKTQAAKEREQFKRWLCPVCKTKNFLEFDRCSKCNLPTHNDSRTVEVFADE